MTSFDHDLIVIGAGSGGVRAARVAAGHGARVAIAEEFRIGGTCVIRGCVPKKLYVLASRFRDEIEDAAGFGWSIPRARFDWATLVAAKEQEITRLSGLYEQNLTRSGVEIIRARATLDGANTVRFADGRVATARHILIATGGGPVMAPSIPGLEWAVSSNEIFDLPALPERLFILGAGYIAVEFACIFARLGSSVTMSYRGELPLRRFDEHLRVHLAAALEQAGVALLPGAIPTAITKTDSGLVVRLENGETVEADTVLVATGRRPATHGLGLETAGVELHRDGGIVVDESSRTSAPSIHAVGDVTDRINLTPVAIREGQAFADRLFGKQQALVDYSLAPSAVFSTPEIGTVGLSEDDARRQYPHIVIYETAFRPMKATLSGRRERAYMKIVVDGESDRVLGVHIFGPEAGEMAQLVAIAVQIKATKADFDATMALHPTMAEELVTLRAPARFHRGDA